MFKKMYRRQRVKLNNNGSTMMIVMVAVSLIAILATVLMAMSYMNYNMKVTEMNSKKNFYTAEVVLDQINAGLQKEISDSLEDAYVRSMQRYTLEDDTTRNTNFANYYIGELRNRLRTASLDSQYQIAPIDTDGDGVYDCGLVHYLDSALQAAYVNGNLKITSDEKKMESVAISKVDPDSGAMVYESQGLVLYDICIEYTDADKFTSVIKTDIRLNTPALTLVTKTAMPNVFDYCLVADAGISGGPTGTTVTFTGDIYAGNDTGSTVERGGINVGNSHTWNFEGESRIVSAGPVMVASYATLNAANQTNCWFESIHLPKYGTSRSGELSLAGNTYVKDDLTIEGDQANVTLGGNYVGFGYGSTATDSSAIILNGKNSTLDMSGLNRLVLGGNAYIQTSKVSYNVDAGNGYGADNNTDILTGNSLAVKSDQIAYLVPAECIGVNGSDLLIGRNPMTAEEYTKWKNYENRRLSGEAKYANYEMVSMTKDTNTLNKSLGELDLNGIGYKTIFRTINGDTLCYLYLDLTEEGAAAYYQEYYYAAQTKMNRYIMSYNNRILMNPTMTEYESKGTILSYALDEEGGNISILDNTMDASRDPDELKDIKDEQDICAGRFERLNAKLTLEESDVTDVELGKTVYANLVNEAVMDALPNTASVTPYVAEISTGNEIKAVFVNNRGVGPYIYGHGDEDICVIVATGDVYLEADFDGLLITDGKVVMNGATSVTPNKSLVLKMLRMKESDAADAPSLIAKFFKNGDKYSLDTSLTGVVTNSMSGQQEISDLIIYENWAKQ